MSGEALYSTPFNITCAASLNPKVVEQLIGFVVLEWQLVDGYNNSQQFEDGVAVEQQYTFSSYTTRSLIFDSLNMTHGGNYMCVARLKIPDSTGSFDTTQLFHLNVFSKPIFCLWSVVVNCLCLFCMQTRQSFSSNLVLWFTAPSGTKTR